MHPFALSLASDDTIFISGLTGGDNEGNMPESAAEQAENAMSTLKALLEREGSSLDEVVWFHPYVTKVEYAFEADTVFRAAFGDAPPASGALLGNVALVSPDMKVEIEAVAIRGARRELVEE